VTTSALSTPRTTLVYFFSISLSAFCSAVLLYSGRVKSLHIFQLGQETIFIAVLSKSSLIDDSGLGGGCESKAVGLVAGSPGRAGLPRAQLVSDRTFRS
jgi:hypothetical protein